jgi:hypothetical protein
MVRTMQHQAILRLALGLCAYREKFAPGQILGGASCLLMAYFLGLVTSTMRHSACRLRQRNAQFSTAAAGELESFRRFLQSLPSHRSPLGRCDPLPHAERTVKGVGVFIVKQGSRLAKTQ